MEIKLIVTDLDGTLLDDDHATVPPRNIAALKAARAKGAKLVIASGRTWSIIRDVADQLGGVDYAILANGAAIRRISDEQHIYEIGIPNPQALALIDLLRQADLPFETYCRGQNYVLERDRDRLGEGLLSPAFAEMYLSRVRFVPDLKEALDGRPMEKINLFYAPPETREYLWRAALTTGPVEIANALEGNMEFTYGGVSKGTALQALSRELGLTAGEVMVFGDANNDLAMLSWAEWSFAMENGTAEARAVARHVTGLNREGGVGQAVEKYVLGE